MPEAFETWTWLPSAKPAVAATALVLLWTLESVVPMFLGRERRASHDLSNLALGLINAGVVALLFGGAVLLVTEWARENSFGLLHWIETPAWIGWPVALVLFDAWMYVWHVLNHKVPLLWRFHSVHHADREVDASTALRFHTGEIVLSTLARLAVLPLIGMTLPQLLLYEAILLPVILFHHSNVRVPPRLDAALRWVIPTPWMHWVHHSQWRPETDSNYGSVLSVWDRVFGSFRLRDDPRELNLGLDEDREEREWRTLLGMLLRPFRPQRSGADRTQVAERTRP
jgi:sterol desaturase/sphingolipid hydroxylase (fatty acid hydroxylase superfamily)